MKIAIDGQRILIDKPAGPELYTSNLIKALAKIDSTNHYTIYTKQKTPADFITSITANKPNFIFKYIQQTSSWTQIDFARQLFIDKPNALFAPFHTLPIIHTLPAIKMSKLKTVAMIHGLEYTHSAEYQNPFLKCIQGAPICYTAKFADKVIVPSQATKNALLARKWVAEATKIKVIYEGVGVEFYKRDADEVAAARAKYNLGQNKYLLFVSTIQPRKNVPRLIEAFAKATRDLQDTNLKLCLAGKLGWLYDEALIAPKKHDVENQVKFLDRVPQADLPALLSGACGLVNVSVEEGFGLPLLEAMAVETPVLASHIAPFKEIAGDCAIYVDPLNIDAIKEGIKDIVTTDTTALVQKAKQQAAAFTWENTAKQTLEVLRTIN